MSTFAGKVALVTGGSSGIGHAIAVALVGAGMSVAIAARRKGKVHDAARALGPEVLAIPTDVSDPDSVARMMAQVVQRFGRLDVLVTNAGVGTGGTVADTPPEVWQRTIGINLGGPYLCARAAWPHLSERGGYILQVASVVGKEGVGGAAAYCASKFGMLGLGDCLAEEGEADGIKVTTICPAYTDTPMVAAAPVPAAEMLRPEDVAATCLYLLSLSPYAHVPEVVLRRAAHPGGLTR